MLHIRNLQRGTDSSVFVKGQIIFVRAVELPEARTAYERALALTRQTPEQRFLEKRLAQLKSNEQ
ncbi:hypothetical protein [Pseudomonas sp. MUP55]|uniref:hypothetical protein n=1 Tax=Pseudomonas sp. MUP55 TaxID=3087234 RepID=UPI002A5AA30F|nr:MULTISPECIES: hypothetical protein [unclassified Pseudomonas]WPN95465.1 hypothetical protein SC319_20410 [Pseudomonas sp. MUP56]WPO00992.1 hypothetical protein SC318_20415 [Pseudomonas sp. MUP55]